MCVCFFLTKKDLVIHKASKKAFTKTFLLKRPWLINLTLHVTIVDKEDIVSILAPVKRTHVSSVGEKLVWVSKTSTSKGTHLGGSNTI